MAVVTAPRPPAASIAGTVSDAARALGLEARIEVATADGRLRLSAGGRTVMVHPERTLVLLNLRDLAQGQDLFSLPTPSDVAAFHVLSALGRTWGEALALPPAHGGGPVDAVVAGPPAHLVRAGLVRWKVETLQVQQSRLWLTHLRVQMIPGTDWRGRLTQVPGTMICDRICTDSAAVSELMADLGWRYLAFPQVVLWYAAEVEAHVTFWLATTQAALDALLLAALIQMDGREADPDRAMAAALAGLKQR